MTEMKPQIAQDSTERFHHSAFVPLIHVTS